MDENETRPAMSWSLWSWEMGTEELMVLCLKYSIMKKILN